MLDLGQLIEQANELAPLPASAVKLAQVISRQDCHLQEVAELIAFDQALTVQLLRAANSAAAAGVIPVTTVQDAVSRMGTAQVLALAVACGAKPMLKPAVPAYGLGEGALWSHSVAAAVAAEIAPNFCHSEIPPESFTAALLHDVGKLIMGRFLSPAIWRFVQQAQDEDHLAPLEAESLILGVHHGELGGLIAQHWRLPESIVQAITFHHSPELTASVICDLAYLGNQAAKRIEAGLEGRAFELLIPAEICQRLGLSPEGLQQFGPVAAARFAQVRRRYNAI